MEGNEKEDKETSSASRRLLVKSVWLFLIGLHGGDLIYNICSVSFVFVTYYQLSSSFYLQEDY